MGKKLKTKTYFVSGMHCQACELLIKNKLEDSSSIKSVDASLSDKTVTIRGKKGKKNSIGFYNKLLDGTGYNLSSHQIGRVVWSQNSIFTAAFTILLIAAVYLLLKSQGYLAYISVTETSSLPGFFVFGVVAGLSSCAALVGGLLLSLSRRWTDLYSGKKSFLGKATPFTMFNVGRLVSYAVFGGFLGVIGSALQLNVSTTALLTLGVSILMIMIALQMLGVPWVSKIRLQLPYKITSNLSNAKKFQGKYMPFLAGAGTFFLPCGFTLLAQTVALTTGSFLMSSMIMFFFALGTLPSLLAISVSSIKFQSNPKFAGTFNLIIGIIILCFGIYNINSQLIVLGLPNSSTILGISKVANTTVTGGLDADGLGAEIVTKNGQKHQNAYMRASRFDYYPRKLTMTSGIPTTMTIESSGVVGCAQAMSLRGLYNDVVYLNKPTQKITFTPKAGTYYISCTMGMVQPVVVTVI